MEALLHNPYFATGAHFAITGLAMIVFLSVFELVTKYQVWEELKRGNLAVAMATGGKIFGIANIFRYSISEHVSFGQGLIWGTFGFLLLLISYFVFEFMSPGYKVDEEIAKGNLAIGFIAMVLSVGFSYIIGASLIT
jgi:putative membrane protein